MSGLRHMKRLVRTTLVWLVLLGMPVLMGMQAMSMQPLKASNCLLPPKDIGTQGMALSSMALELAGSGAQVISLVRPVAKAPAAVPPKAQEDMCAALHIQFLQDQHTHIDARLFMPLYATLSLLLSAWVALQSLTAEAQSGPRLGKGVLWALGAVVLITAVLLVLDHRENTKAMDLLASVANTQVSQPNPASLDLAAQATRQASWMKWLASGWWSLTLAWALKPWRSVDATRPLRWSRAIARALFLGGAAMFFMGAVWAAVSDAWQGPVTVLQVGMVLVLVAILVTGLLVQATPLGAPSPKPSPPDHLETGPMREFHLEEYRQLRAEMTALLARLETLFRAAIIAVATAFAWLATHSIGVTSPQDPCLKLPDTMVTFAWLIPPAFVLGTGLMSCTMGGRVQEIGGYLLQLEQALGRGADLGWEAYLARQKTTVTPMVRFLWVLLLAATVAATCVGLSTLEQADSACHESKSSSSQAGTPTPIAALHPSDLTARASGAMSPRTRPRPSHAPTVSCAGTSGSTTRWGRA